jgi:hypothetical protein
MCRQSGGAVLVFAVLLLAAGVFVLTGIAQLAATQAVVGQNEWAALNRRITLENSRAMARQYVLSTMFSNVVPTSPVGYTDPGAPTLGGFSVSNTAGPGAGLYWDHATTASGQLINPYSPMERGGFYPGVAEARLVSEVAGGATNFVDWLFLVRLRSPVAAGYTFVQQRPADRDLQGFISCVDATNFAGYPSVPQMPVSSVTNTNVSPSESDGYRGYFGIPVGNAATLTFINTNAPVVAGGNAQVIVDLRDPGGGVLDNAAPGAVYEYRVPASTNTATTTSLLLVGADDRTLPPLRVVIPSEASGLTNVVLSGGNSRAVYINARPIATGATNLAFTTNAAGVGPWRIGISASSRDLSFADVPIEGGVRSDRNFTNDNLSGDIDPQGLDFIADLMMWLEDYRAR